MQKGRDNAPRKKSRIFLGEGKRQIKLFLIIASSIIVIDQLSKLWIRGNLTPGESVPEAGFLRLTHVQNTGATFGLFANQTFLLIVLSVVCLLIILLIFRYLTPATTLSSVFLSLIFGGAIGNLIDRIRFSYVTDFIDIRLWHNFHWPAFNIADTAIVAGIVILIYFLVHVVRKERVGD